VEEKRLLPGLQPLGIVLLLALRGGSTAQIAAAGSKDLFNTYTNPSLHISNLNIIRVDRIVLIDPCDGADL
jgi:hypothetical protein